MLCVGQRRGAELPPRRPSFLFAPSRVFAPLHLFAPLRRPFAMSRRFFLPFAVLGALASLFALALRTEDGPPIPPPTPPPAIEALPGLDPNRDDPGRLAKVIASAHRHPDEQPMYGFCPEHEDAGYNVPRPDLAGLLSLRASEMMDQVRHTYRAGRGSSTLRHGLDALFSGREDEALQTLRKASDRQQNGFDYASSAAIVLGAQALSRGAISDATRFADLAISLAGEDPLSHVLDALVAERSHGQGSMQMALRRAHALSPEEPAVALALGQILAQTVDLPTAIEALSMYLKEAPMDQPIGQLRERLRTQRDLHRDLSHLSGGGLTLLWPSPELSEAEADAIHDELSAALTEAAALLAQRRREELLVVIYRERSDMLASTCVPQWTEGVFDGVLRLHVQSLVPAGHRAAVIRHEILHAQLRSSPIDAPHWFHEGVAQYFAKEESGDHRQSYRMMVRNETYVPFASLEGSFLVISAGSDASLAYHQSLAMVQMLVDLRGERVLAEAVRHLESEGEATRLWEHLLGERATGDELLAFLARRLEHRTR